MKRTALGLLTGLLIATCCGAADTPATTTPRFLARVVCFNGKVDSRSSCAFIPNGVPQPTGKMICGHPGKVSEIEWSYVGRQGNKDVYRFTRRFPANTDSVTTTNRSVEFSNTRVVVFEDDSQVIVMEPPKQ